MTKKICVVTASRSEYGLLHWIIDAVYNDPELELQLVVTGAHLSPEQGLTYHYIEEDGYPITAKVPMLLYDNNEVGIAKSMGTCLASMADTFNKLHPDLLVVLGDRYELLPIVSAALMMRIPIAHIGGGDVTEGAIDDEIRNAVTMMSTLHFPSVAESAQNIKRMRGSVKNVITVGEPGLDAFLRFRVLSKEEIAHQLQLDLDKRWCLVTLHPETKLTIEDNIQMANNLYEAMLATCNIQYVITKANADAGGTLINEFWTNMVSTDRERFRLYPSLGRTRYLSVMKYVDLVLGNSSSGIIESPYWGTPVVNIGKRQEGRHICRNVIESNRDKKDIAKAIEKALMMPRITDTYWGDGHSSERIVEKIKEFLNNE